MGDIVVKKAGINNVQQLQQISKQTFLETFSATNSEENMNSYIEDSFSISRLTNELENPNSEFYFATHNDQIIGYLKLNYGSAQTELQDDKAIEIERIYVSSQFLGKKVGQLLYQHSVEIAINQHAKYLWLGVWEKNERAISFYKRNGFIEFDKHIFILGDDEQTDIMMRLDLQD